MNSSKPLALAVAVSLAFTYVAEATSRTYDDYLYALGRRDSGNNYRIRNSLGYLGRFQFGEAALTDCRLYRGDTTRKNDWIGSWADEAGDQGVRSTWTS